MGTIRTAVATAILLSLFTHPAAAADFVGIIGVGAKNDENNASITVSVPFSGVAAGNSIIVTLQASGLDGELSCSDPVNGPYDADVTSGEAADGRIAIASKHNVLALQFGDLITCTYPLFIGASSIGVYEFSGLESVNTLDQTAQNASSEAGAASSGLTAATAQADELVIGLVWVPNGFPIQSFATAAGYTALFGMGNQSPMYRFVSSVGQYEANGTVSGDGGWKAQVATYRAAADLCDGVTCDDGNPCTVDACAPATGECEYVPGNFRDLCRPSAGECDVAERCDGVNAECPADGFAAIETQCGNPEELGDCDHADSCDGSGSCLSNRPEDGTACGGDPPTACTNQFTCEGGLCQNNGLKPVGTLCGDGEAGACNGADTCNASGVCETNVAADGTACGDAGTACVNQDLCESGVCQDEGFVLAGAACGDPSSGPCDQPDSCDGSGVCESNSLAAGASCSDGEECTIEDACDSSGQCVGAANPVCFVCNENSTPVVATAVVAEPVGPRPFASGGAQVTVAFDDEIAQSHTCSIEWGDGSLPDAGTVTEPTASSPGSCSGAHLYTGVGVYEVAITVADECGTSAGTTYQYFVFYDPSAGFVTGGGWINSPAGAFTSNPTVVGKANFGFVAKYDKKANAAGETQFHLAVANFRFDSTSYEWFVVSGAKARYRGVGTVNGAPGYNFELTAWDGQCPGGGGVDRFRIKVWFGNPSNVVYDNLLGQGDNADPTPLGGGSIVIHKK